MKIKTQKGWKGKADKLFSEIIRSTGVCLRCGSRSSLQCAHIISRRYSSTRTDLNNAWALCSGCHLRLTNWPQEHMEFVEKTIGMDKYWELKRKAETVIKMDWEVEYARLKEVRFNRERLSV